MESLEVSGKTVEEAIQKALEQLGASRNEVEVAVLSEGKHGLLGLGAEEAVVRVGRLEPVSSEDGDMAQVAKEILEALLDKLEVDAAVEVLVEPVAEGAEAGPISLEVRGDDLGILIGRRGQTLSCLEYMLRLILSHQSKTWLPVVIDVEGYKRRRQEALEELAQRIAERVKAKGVAFTLRPMPANERRIIHITLADDPDVTTESTGEGEARRVMVLLQEE
ncbi:RNA-binding cell elongation regulator Jag/EloR [Chloroflexota bacterium]